MSEWKEYKLGELGTVITGKTPSSRNPEDWGEEMLFVTPSDYRNYRKYAKDSERKLSSAGIERFKTKVLPPKSVLVTCIGSDMGKVVMNDAYCMTNQQINAIIPHAKVDNDFLYYTLVSIYDTLRIYGGDGTAVPIVNKNDFENIKVEIPTDIDEQKRIASILSSLDDKIDLLNRENATLEAMAETLFRQWFIEEAKEDWEESTIDMYANHYKESVNPQKQPSTMFWHYSIPAFDNGKKPIDEMGEEIQSSKYIIPSNCILFSKLNPHKDKRVWLILDSVPTNAICSTEFQIVKPKEKEYLYFLYGWLTNKENYEEIASGVGGTSGSHQRIDPKSIFTFACPHVDIGILQRYNKVVKPLFLKQRENQKQIITLTEQRNRLLPNLMSNVIKYK